jgi:NAD(P)-dependent dehydrogenase (short-subunit alcohol dehydrogenase family)
MDLQLTGRVAVVSGASKGIGLAVVTTLLGEGARVVATSRTSTPELDKLAGPDLLHVPADLMDPTAPARVIDAAIGAYGGMDVLVNNAGGPAPGVTLPRESFVDASDADWGAMFEFNLFSVVRMIRAALPHLLARGGSVVNVSSGNARQPSRINTDYGAAKAALTNLGKALSEEFADRGVRFNTVSPGPTRTPWWTDEGGVIDIIAAQAGADRGRTLTEVIPTATGLTIGRMIEAHEIADAVALLASPRSAATTGADWAIDGGFVKAV